MVKVESFLIKLSFGRLSKTIFYYRVLFYITDLLLFSSLDDIYLVILSAKICNIFSFSSEFLCYSLWFISFCKINYSLHFRFYFFCVFSICERFNILLYFSNKINDFNDFYDSIELYFLSDNPLNDYIFKSLSFSRRNLFY